MQHIEMDDRLVWLLNAFELHAKVFQAGPLCGTSLFDGQDGRGYIHVLRKGTLEVETRGQPTLSFKEPALIFFMNPLEHRLLPYNEAETVCASFEFGGGLGNPLTRALPAVFSLRLRDAPSLSTTLSLLFTEASEQHCGRQAVLDRLIEIVIVRLLRDLMDQKRLRIGLLAGLADAKLAKAINAMHAQPAHAWTLETLAAVAGMSRARFAANFRGTVGTPPLAYLTEWRISAAQSLLSRGKSIACVANAVGYGGASTLSRAFVACTGVSPKVWLQRQQRDTTAEPPIR